MGLTWTIYRCRHCGAENLEAGPEEIVHTQRCPGLREPGRFIARITVVPKRCSR
jgi:hypothetical protein